MNRTPVKSSMIASLGYDPATQTLEVEFTKNHAVYQYSDVTPELFKEFMDSPSKGSFLRQRIQLGGHRFTKIAAATSNGEKE